MPIDLYSKSAVIIQAGNNVSSLQATLEITILPSSISILVLLPCFFVLFLILACILAQLDCKRNQLPVRTIDDVRVGLEKPVGEWIAWSVGEWIAWSVEEWIAWSVGEWIAWSAGEWIAWSAGEWIAWSAGEWIAWSVGEWITWSTTTISILQYNYTLPIPPFSDPPCNLMQYFLLVSYTHTKMIEVTNLPINYQLPSPLPSHHTIQSIDHNIPTFSSLRATCLQPSFEQLLNGEPN